MSIEVRSGSDAMDVMTRYAHLVVMQMVRYPQLVEESLVVADCRELTLLDISRCIEDRDKSINALVPGLRHSQSVTYYWMLSASDT